MANPRTRTTPIVPQVTLPGLTPGRLSARVELDGARITGDLNRVHAPDGRLLECELVDAQADEAMLRGSSWAESRWLRVGATSLDLAAAVLRDTVWEGCRIGALTLPGATLTRVVLRDCKLDYVNLRQATVSDLTLERCSIGELDVGEARLVRVRAADSGIGLLRLSGAHSEHVDLSGAGPLRLEGLEGLRGVTVSQEQAFDLATALVAHLGGRVAVDGGDPPR